MCIYPGTKWSGHDRMITLCTRRFLHTTCMLKQQSTQYVVIQEIVNQLQVKRPVVKYESLYSNKHLEHRLLCSNPKSYSNIYYVRIYGKSISLYVKMRHVSHTQTRVEKN